jgi:predicted transcriptional regulator of viral defense system
MPVQYVIRGEIPPAYYIDQLMADLGKPYYVSLLSAAEYHGAAHQRAQRLCVTTIPPQSRVSAGKGADSVIWIYRESIPEELIQTRNTETGTIRYSNPELTSVDLVRFSNHIGGLNRVATVLAELVEVTDFSRNFNVLLQASTVSALQRLGYILEEVLHEKAQADTLRNMMKEHNVKCNFNVPLDITSVVTDEFPRSKRWSVVINDVIEIDEI